MSGKLIMHIVGNRPQFVKLSPFSKELKKRGYRDVIVHTGQHYDANMSAVFFEELGIDEPIENLGIGSGSHAEMTAKALIGVEKVVQKYSPEVVVLYGDTDSTCAAALACAKLNVFMVHVEAGVRSHSEVNPEEKNRVIVDHLSQLLFCSDRASVANLAKEGLGNRAYLTGDIMYDTFLQTKGKYTGTILSEYGLEKDNYVLLTWHRQENTESKEAMQQILEFICKIPCKVLYPIHPRTRKMLQHFGLMDKATSIENLVIVNPVGYEEMVYLQCNCKVILTDSGGLSKESVFAGVRCLYMMDGCVWPDLEKINWVQHIDFNDSGSIENALKVVASEKEKGLSVDFYGDGHAAKKMVDIIEVVVGKDNVKDENMSCNKHS